MTKQPIDKDINSNETEPVELSAIKIFKHIQQNVKKINTPPLTEDLLEINKDVYKELGSGETDGMVFARIGMPFPKTFSDLTFDMIFAEDGAALAIGGNEFVFSHYAHLGTDEKDIANKLTNILIGLSNGQLAILNTFTQDNDKLQAWEILYREPNKQLYDALATYAVFDSARKLKDRELATQKFANSADINDVSIDIDAYKAFTFETTWLNKFNREQITGLHVPLTREDWEKSVDVYYDNKADGFMKKMNALGNKSNKTTWEQIVYATRWRHLELMWWSLALMLYQPITEWSLEYLKSGIIVFGLFVIFSTIYRNNESFRKYFTSFRVAGYIGYILANLIFFSSYPTDNVWWYVLGLLAFLAFVENVFFDIYMARAEKKTKRA